MLKEKNPKVSRKKPVIINKRDIFDVSLEPYTIRCECGFENRKQIKCHKCGKVLSLSHKMGGFRPVLVVSSPVINPTNWGDEMVLAIPITTNTTYEYEYPNTVLLPVGETGLDRPSLAMLFEILSIDRANFYERNRRGKVKDEDWIKVESKLRVVMEIDKEKIFFRGKEITQAEAEKIMNGYLYCLQNHSNYDELTHTAPEAKKDYEQKKQKFFQEKGKELGDQRKIIEQLTKEVDKLNEELTDCKKKQEPYTHPLKNLE